MGIMDGVKLIEGGIMPVISVYDKFWIHCFGDEYFEITTPEKDFICGLEKRFQVVLTKRLPKKEVSLNGTTK